MIVQTPGVYIREKNNLPSSVAGVSTAVPVFIGVTEKRPADQEPVRITSLFEYVNAFGGEFQSTFEVSVTASGSNYDVDHAVPNKRFFMYDSLTAYFTNGGGPCYIYSVGTYDDVSSLGDLNTALNTAVSSGSQVINNLDEVTLILAPDLYAQFEDTNTAGQITSLDVAGDFKALAGAIINKCGELQDKFAIFDYASQSATDLEMRTAMSPTLSTDLKYGALYYPWLVNAGTPSVRFDQISGYTPQATNSSRGLFDKINANHVEISDIATAFGLPVVNFAHLNSSFEDLHRTFIDSANKTNFTAVFKFVYDAINTLQSLDANANAAGELKSRLSEIATNSLFHQEVIKTIRLFTLLKADSFLLASATTWGDISDQWFGASASYTLSDAESDPVLDRSDLEKTVSGSPVLMSSEEVMARLVNGNYIDIELIFNEIAGLTNKLLYSNQLTESNLFSLPDYQAIRTAIQNYLKQVPTQGAIAGIYCKNDRDRGVWKSPANIAVQGIERPLVEVSNSIQDNLNVDATTGKSINVIRTFTGKGSLVWGARTLAGNDNEWRYISVRRFFSYAEESIEKAMVPFVFEPNNARTWVKMRATITSFLVAQWQAGALVGASVDEAFFVRVGKETTSAQEILEGKINIQIGLAVARPAEFIILEFSHYTKS